MNEQVACGEAVGQEFEAKMGTMTSGSVLQLTPARSHAMNHQTESAERLLGKSWWYCIVGIWGLANAMLDKRSLWRLRPTPIRRRFSWPPGPLAYASHRQWLALPQNRFVPRIVAGHSGHLLAKLQSPQPVSLTGYAFSANGRYLAAAEPTAVQVWDLSAWRAR